MTAQSPNVRYAPMAFKAKRLAYLSGLATATTALACL